MQSHSFKVYLCIYIYIYILCQTEIVASTTHIYFQNLNNVRREGDRVSVIHSPEKEKRGEIIVPRGQVWLQGDNSSTSRDSREYGPVPLTMLQGKAIYKVTTVLKTNYNRINLSHVDHCRIVRVIIHMRAYLSSSFSDN